MNYYNKKALIVDGETWCPNCVVNLYKKQGWDTWSSGTPVAKGYIDDLCCSRCGTDLITEDMMKGNK